MHHVLLVCNTFPALTQWQHLQYKELHFGRPKHTASHQCVASSSHPHSLSPQSIFITALALPEFQYEQPYLN